MSYIKDIQESNHFIISIIISLISIPFWYLSIYTFNPDFLLRSNLLLISCSCFCLNTSSLFILSICTHHLLNEDNDSGANFAAMISLATMIQVFILSIMLFIGHTTTFFFNSILYFYSFISIYFFLIISLGIILKRYKFN